MAKKLMKKYAEGSAVKSTTPAKPAPYGNNIYDKATGNIAVKPVKKTGGVVKNKTGNAASRGLMKKGGSTKSKKKC